MTEVSDLPSSAAEAAPPDNTSQWLRNLDVDFDESNAGPTTPVPSTPGTNLADGASTPALPEGIEESVGTTTPRRFAPDEDDRGTISDVTYDDIRK